MRRHWVGLAMAVSLIAGCGGKTTATSSGSSVVQDDVNAMIAEIRPSYFPLAFDPDQDLVGKLDKIEAQIAGKATGKPTRFLPKLPESEERAHFVESFRQWEKKTGLDVRSEIDSFKADLAAEKKTNPKLSRNYLPDAMRSRYKPLLGDLVAIERSEMNERRRLAIVEKSKAIFDKHRAAYPDEVKRLEAVLNALPSAKTGSTPTAKKSQ